jgi:hypothetical protein
MEFKEFNAVLQQHCEEMFKTEGKLFAVDIDKDELWNLYLDSFPPGTNEIFRERREHDCSCCKQFIRSFGNVVCIKNNKLVSIWDFDLKDATYATVVKALARYVKKATIKDVFVTKESKFGVVKNHEQTESGVRTWHHFNVVLPKQFITRSSRSEAELKGEFRETRNVFKRSMEEITKDSIETVLDLISQKALYKGDEWKQALTNFFKFYKEYHKTPENQKDIFCWVKSIEAGPAISRIKNHSIGVLLSDIAKGVELDEAVRKYEAIVAPTNYKRPKAIFTKKMLEDAKKTVEELGYAESLKRRHAVIDDITVNNILFANKDAHSKMSGDVFDDLLKETKPTTKKFNKLAEVDAETFVKEILPSSESVEVLFENKHISNLVSLIAPENRNAKSMFKWNNNFSWAYNGNITDSMKQRVKEAGGDVEGVLRFSIQWNEENDNKNDFDAHCIEPSGNRIWFSKKRNNATGGFLDVDIIKPHGVAVENISWPTLGKMKPGKYKFMVHNYSHRGGRNGFRAEIEFDGQIFSFDYRNDIKQGQYVDVAEVELQKGGTFKMVKSLDSSLTKKTEWSITTNEFHPVSVCMFSPNYWDEQKGIGHKHYFFIIKDCKNETEPNGFFNEFLKEDLNKHKRVFEALGSKMKVEATDKQLSGLGFSSTKKNSLICKVTGTFDRTIKVNF